MMADACGFGALGASRGPEMRDSEASAYPWPPYSA